MPQIERNHQDKAPSRLTLVAIIVLAVLLLAAWIQTMTVFRPSMIELSARADRQLAEASELLDQAREMSGEGD